MSNIKNKLTPDLKRTILDKLADYLARRDHSEKELKEKLQKKSFNEDSIEWVISQASAKGWLKSPKELTQQIFLELNKKNKGILYINNQLQKKGLPSIPIDEDVEHSKAIELLSHKFENFPNLKEKDLEKACRHLQAKGFTEQTTLAVVYENRRS